MIIYTLVVLIIAIRPQTLRPDEVRSPEIVIDASGQRFLHMEVYAGHSALNPDGAILRRNQNKIIVKPVYCLIDPPVTLCRPKVKTEILGISDEPIYMVVRLKLPGEPKTVILKFRDGTERVVQE